MSKEYILKLLREYCKSGDFTLSSGKKSNFYIDCRSFLMNKYCLERVSHIICSNIPPTTQYIGGPAMGAIPIVTATIMGIKGVNGFYVRDNKKSHGTKCLIEGDIEKGSYITLVDDVITTGQSIINTIQVLKEYDCIIDKIICIADREQGAKQMFQSLNIPYEPMFSLEELYGS